MNRKAEKSNKSNPSCFKYRVIYLCFEKLLEIIVKINGKIN